jgi:uncharacterized protein (DUF433 family)
VAKLRFDPTKTLGFIDPRETPTYGIPEAAHYLRLPTATLRSWMIGRTYPTKAGGRRFRPVIQIADPKNNLLSFLNLAEAHILSAFRRVHAVKLDKIRNALDFVTERLACEHPLISQDFETDGVSLFVTQYGKLIDASEHGQQVIREALEQRLQRLDWEQKKIVRLWPFTRPIPRADNPKSVFIDPRYSFGRLVLASIGIPTATLNERFAAGESIQHLADDYGCAPLDIEEAVRCEGGSFDAAA